MQSSGFATTTTWRRTRRVAALLAVSGLGVAGSAAAAPNGPVIVGGDAFPKNGSFNSGISALEDGWLAMSRELAFVAPKVGRTNDASVVVLGAAPSMAISDDGGASIGRAVAALGGFTTTYVEGAEAIHAFFALLAAGDAIPAVIWIPGNGAANSLTTAEITALDAHADEIAAFVAGGGGLIAHGDGAAFGASGTGWLARLLPGIEVYGGPDGGLVLTPAGAVALPGLTDPQISTGLWRNAFRGTLGGLDVLAEAATAIEPGTAAKQKVVLGGGTAWAGSAPADLRVTTSARKVVDRGDTVAFDVTVTNRGPNVAGSVILEDQVPPGFTLKRVLPGAGTCTPGATVRCVLGNLGFNRAVTTRIVMTARTTGRHANIATVRTITPDPTAADTRSVSRVSVKLTRLRTSVGLPVRAFGGDVLTVRMSVTNTGSRVAKRAVLRAPTPGGFTLQRRPSGARVEKNASIWELGNIGPGRTKTVTFRLKIDRATAGTRCLIATGQARNAGLVRGRDCLRIF